MSRNEEGEFELVLGNRQLLSVFFILVVLMGVFFAMGYIVGRNNPSKDAVEFARRRDGGDTGASDKGSAIVVDPDKATTKPSPAEEKSAEPPKPAETPKQEKKAEPKKEEPKPEPVKTVEKQKTEPPKPVEPPKKQAEAPKPPPPAAPGGQPQAGQTFLQVVAIDKAGADALVETLRKKSFAAVVGAGPSDKIFRVLVGPMKDASDIAKTKMDLEAVGFKGAIVRKY